MKTIKITYVNDDEYQRIKPKENEVYYIAPEGHHKTDLKDRTEYIKLKNP